MSNEIEVVEDVKLYTNSDELLGKIVTIRNVEHTDLSITGKVSEVKLTEADGVTYISEVTFKSVGGRDLYTPAKAASTYTTKSWYWIVEAIA